MASIIRVPKDTRWSDLGAGLGNLIGAVAEAKLKKEEEDKRKKALKESLDLFSAALGGEGIEQPVDEGTRKKEALRQGGGPTKKAAQALNTLPTKTKKVPSGSDIAARMVEAGVDEKFAITLAAGVDEARVNREKEAQKSAAFEQALSVMQQEGATRQDIVQSIMGSDLSGQDKSSMLQNVDKLLPPDAEETSIKIFSKETGDEITVPVPKAVAGSLALRNAFVEENFEGFSASPVATAETKSANLKGAALDAMLERGEITQTTRDKIASNAIEVKGPDPEGRIALVDKTNNTVSFVGGGFLTTASLTRLDEDIRGITQTIQLLQGADASQAGIMGILESEVGGVMLQVPAIGAITRALGLSDDEVAQAQASRAGFYATLAPIAQSFSRGGTRSAVGSPTAIRLAERIVNMTKWSSTPAGAQLAKDQLLSILRDTKAQMIAQRITRSAVPPVMTNINWQTDKEGNLTFKVGKPESEENKSSITLPSSLPPISPEKRSKVGDKATSADFDKLALAVTGVESNEDDSKVGKDNERSRFQVLPSTGKDPGLGVKPAKDDSIAEYRRVGREYLKALMVRYDNNEDYALAAYNWGFSKVDNWIAKGGNLKDLPQVVREYISKVQVRRELND